MHKICTNSKSFSFSPLQQAEVKKFSYTGLGFDMGVFALIVGKQIATE